MENCKFSAAVLLLLCWSASGHRILGLFPHPGLSHFHFFQPVMKALVEAGHEVTVVSHFPNDLPIENYKDEPLKGKTDGLKNFINLDVSLSNCPIFCRFNR
jgi:glucuronosyltransferase